MKNQTSAKNQKLIFKTEAYFTDGISYDSDDGAIGALANKLTAKSLVRDVYLSINKKLLELGLEPLVGEKTQKEVSEAKKNNLWNVLLFMDVRRTHTGQKSLSLYSI